MPQVDADQTAGSSGGAPSRRGARPIDARSEAAAANLAIPGPDWAMPTDFAISVARTRAADQLINRPGGERRQPLAGYEDTFVDIVDFILRVTHRIWEEKAVGYLYEHYAHNVRVVADEGFVYGRERVIEDSIRLMSAFPDMRLIADEIIWCGDEDLGFWTSHRLTAVARNTGWSVWGPPTGRRIAVTMIAHCYSWQNQISEEFAVYNTASMLRQIGVDPLAVARATAGALPVEGVASGDLERVVGQGSPPTLDPDEPGVGAFVRRALHEIWNWRLLNRISEVYAAGFRYHGPGDSELYGRGAYLAHVLATLTTYPDAVHLVENIHWMGNDEEGYSVHLRWSLVGTHRGPGPLGEPTGRRVRQWGMTHLHVRQGLIVEEWTVANELDALRQVHRAEPV
jgi:predicted ester cyclase